MSFQKRAPRYSINDWFSRSYSNWKNSEKTRLAGREVAEESKYLRNEADNRSKWQQQDSNGRLSDLVERTRVIKESIEEAVRRLDDEVNKMGVSKDITEKLQTFFYERSKVNTENLVWREGRREIDLVVDEVEEELHKEKIILDSMRQKMQAKISEMFEQQGVTKEARHTLLQFLQRKRQSVDCDIEQYNLGENSPSITLKPRSTDAPEKMYSMHEWQEVLCGMQQLALGTLQQSAQLRETIQHVVDAVSNDIQSQHLLVMFTLRKRIHQLQMALSEDTFQKKLLEEEAKRLEDEIRCIDVCLKHKMKALKVAHTRLENRHYKTMEELVHDEAECGLSDEVKQIEMTMLTLKDKKCQAQHSLNSMERQTGHLQQDMDNKALALRLEQQCLLSRQAVAADCTALAKQLQEAIVQCHPDRPHAI